jgi:oligopeptide/dipeptide ABC transporter ATP-binding protein
LTIKELPFVEAVKVEGGGTLNVLFRQIFPNALPSIAVIASINVADSVITEADFTYLGLGVDVAVPDWGFDIYYGYQSLLAGAWWTVFLPGLMVVLLAGGFTFIGEGLSEVLNPRLGKRQMVLLEVKELDISYTTLKGEVRAVQGVSFDLKEQETLGIVGEPGCGKSTLGFALLNLVPSQGKVARGKILLDGEDFLALDKKQPRRVRGKMVSMIFQDPMTSLNPVKKIRDHFVEAIRAHDYEVTEERALEKAGKILGQLGMSPDTMADYPHQLSGGMKQRIMIGLSLALDPRLLVADEPTTSLDVVIEAQILDLLRQLKGSLKLSMILITHNLGIVAEVADKIAIMYGGEIFEFTDTRTMFRKPFYPYTQLLLKLVPNIALESTSLEWIPGSPPDLSLPIPGCKFAARCPYAFDRCKVDEPKLVEREPGHLVSCHLYGK